MAEEAGFQIGKRIYPFPQRFRLGDPILVEQLTGLTWPEFAQRLPDEDDEEGIADDPIAMIGFLACAVSRDHPEWRRDRVIRYVQGLGMEDVQVVGPALEDEESPPPEGANGAKTSSTSPQESRSEQDHPSEALSPSLSGTPTSATSPE